MGSQCPCTSSKAQHQPVLASPQVPLLSTPGHCKVPYSLLALALTRTAHTRVAPSRSRHNMPGAWIGPSMSTHDFAMEGRAEARRPLPSSTPPPPALHMLRIPSGKQDYQIPKEGLKLHGKNSSRVQSNCTGRAKPVGLRCAQYSFGVPRSLCRARACLHPCHRGSSSHPYVLLGCAPAIKDAAQPESRTAAAQLCKLCSELGRCMSGTAQPWAGALGPTLQLVPAQEHQHRCQGGCQQLGLAQRRLQDSALNYSNRRQKWDQSPLKILFPISGETKGNYFPNRRDVSDFANPNGSANHGGRDAPSDGHR